MVLSVEFIQTNVFYLLILIVYLVDMQRYHSPFSLTPPLAPNHRNNNCSSLVSSFIYMYIYYAYIPTESILPVQFLFLFSTSCCQTFNRLSQHDRQPHLATISLLFYYYY